MTTSAPGAPWRFATTRWSVVLRARATDQGVARVALDTLCRQSWFPLYGYARRRGFQADDAQDLTQGFFAALLAGEGFLHLDPERGRLRSFLLTAMQNYIAKEERKARALKRGGGRPPVSFDVLEAERRFQGEAGVEPRESRTPEREYERQWALERIERVMTRLEAEYRAAGRGELFGALRPTLIGQAAATAETALSLQTSPGAVRVATWRLRRRFGELLRREIAQTVAHESDIEDEIGHLLEALAP